MASWLVLAMFAVSGCAMVGFDESDAEPNDDDHGGKDETPIDSGTAGLDAGDGGAADADADADVDANASSPDGGEEDEDGGGDCPEPTRCEDGVFVECEDGVERMTDCGALSQTCRVARCDPLQGCIVEDAEDGTHCEDGKLCTLTDQCILGQCKSGSVRNCEALDGPCTLGVCSEEADGICKPAPTNQSASCGGELVCDQGLCSSGDLCAAQGCTLVCSVDTGPCDFTCGGSEACDFTCAAGATCQFDCSGAGSNCAVLCAAGSTCTVACASESDCENVTCDATASCALMCGQAACP